MTSFTNLSVLVLATMVAVLAGMVGYMYWQQSRVIQAVTSLSQFVASQFVKQPNLEVQNENENEDDSDSEDDRESVLVVEEESDKNLVSAPAPVPAPAVVEDKPVEIVTDIDDLQGKTAPELKELLSKKGIPYGKRDSKSVLLQLLKASS